MPLNTYIWQVGLNEEGNCVLEPEPCVTEDEILSNIEIQNDLNNTLWFGSKAVDTDAPMSDRLEQGGWIVEVEGGYDIVFFPPTWSRDACGMYPPSHWASTVPANVVGVIHSHPFYVGEDRRSVCETDDGTEIEEAYVGGPSNADYKFILTIMNHLNDFTIKGYVIDGNHISSYDYTGSHGVEEFIRCGY